MKSYIENFSNHFRDILSNAASIALDSNNKEVLPEHLFFGLISQEHSLAYKILKKNKTKIELKTIHQPEDIPRQSLPILHETTMAIIDDSTDIAQKLNSSQVGSEHLLLALITSKDAFIINIVKEFKINKKEIQNEVEKVTQKINSVHSNFSLNSLFHNDIEVKKLTEKVKKQTRILESFAVDLTEIKKINLDPVISREQEINRLSEILLRRQKNNPILLGEPGVGKTAIIEGLALQIANGTAPVHLLNKKIFSLDINSLIAGTIYRGEFESRVKDLISDIQSRDDVIIFIDEIHNIIGSGSSQGSMDVANILKPALSRGNIKFIGATTLKEYKKFIRDDQALDRRFQPIYIKEPSVLQATKMIKGIKKKYENFHKIKISDEVIKASIELSNKYLTDRYLPDKAIDILDEASSRKKMQKKLHENHKKIIKINSDIEKILIRKNDAILEENITEIDKLNNLLIDFLVKKKEFKKAITNTKSQKPLSLTLEDIAQIISTKTNIPVSDILKSEKSRLVEIKKEICKDIVGQDDALKEIFKVITRSSLGFSDDLKIKGSFIFTGPSGVGKTQTAKLLASKLFNDSNALIKLDMSEFSQPHSISKLIGSPAGYVGYKEESKLTSALRKNPGSIILFDEIEKAHPDIFNLLLQIIDDGYMTDSSGNKIDFRNTYIILTSNLIDKNKDQAIGFDADANYSEFMNKKLKEILRPELLNRIDKIVYFNELNEEHLSKIAKNNLNTLKSRLKKNNIEIKFNNNIYSDLLKNINTNGNAREVKKLINNEIETILIDKILDSKKRKFEIYKEQDEIKVR